MHSSRSRLMAASLLVSALVASSSFAGEEKKKQLPQVATSASQSKYRIYPESVKASSFLWDEKNRFQENYHPNYLFDDSPASAWVEGAKSNGVSETLQCQFVNLFTKELRLRFKNGYQKSDDTFSQNARVKSIKVTLEPSDVSQTFNLSDSQDPQEFTVAQAQGALESVTIEILSVYPGSKYEDLAISDIELYADVAAEEQEAWRQQENASRILAWKKSRSSIAKAWKSTTTPLSPIYERSEEEPKEEKVPVKETKPEEQEPWNPRMMLSYAIRTLQERDASKKADLETLQKLISLEDKAWKPTKVTFSKTSPLPSMLFGINNFIFEYSQSEDSYLLPQFLLPVAQKNLLLQNTNLSLRTSTEKKIISLDYTNCKKEGLSQLWVNTSLSKGQQTPRELLLQYCSEDPMSREGVNYSMALYYLVYDEQGKLSVLATNDPEKYQFTVQTFSWSATNPSMLEGGLAAKTELRASENNEDTYTTMVSRFFAPVFAAPMQTLK